MDQIISFPGLGLEFNLDEVAFRLPKALGEMPIYWYGVLIATGFLLAMLYILKRSPIFGLDSDRAFDVTFLTIILGIIGARLYYVAFSGENYSDDLLKIFNIRLGGLAIYGGIIFGILGICLGCKVRKVKLLPMLDLTVGGVLIGQAIGRWGNFFNKEAFGSNTSLPWGMTSPAIQDYLTANQQSLSEVGMIVNPSQPVHPTFLYESLWCILGFFLILYFTKKRRFDGQLMLFYLAWYGFGRFFIEGLRTDSLMIGQFRVSQLVALLCFVISSVILLVTLQKIKKKDDTDYLRLYVESEESQQILKGEFYKKTKKEAVKDQEEKSSEDTGSESDIKELIDTATEDHLESEIAKSVIETNDKLKLNKSEIKEDKSL